MHDKNICAKIRTHLLFHVLWLLHLEEAANAAAVILQNPRHRLRVRNELEEAVASRGGCAVSISDKMKTKQKQGKTKARQKQYSVEQQRFPNVGLKRETDKIAASLDSNFVWSRWTRRMDCPQPLALVQWLYIIFVSTVVRTAYPARGTVSAEGRGSRV